MAGRLFLISVGTSLLGKVNQHFFSKMDPLPNEEKDWLDDEEHWSKELSSCLQQVPDSGLSNLAAELSSLFKDPNYPKPTNEDTFLLLHTATTMGAVCADRLAFLLRQKLGDSTPVCCYEVEDLNEAQSQDFYAKGLPNLLAKLQQELDRAKAADQQVILVPTGGYKAIIPYFVIMGLLYDCPCIYVYEDSDLVATLPALPLHADLARWSSLEAVIETLTGKDAAKAKQARIYQDHAPMLALLLYERDGTLQPSPLCQVLQGKVSIERRRSELEFRTRNSPLLNYLTKSREDGRDTSLADYFQRLAAIGPFIWKGDRVPEMADHALLHHADLFHLAERLLLPIFYLYEQQGRIFLSPEELFVLLGALHLHDCGHVVGWVDLEDGGSRQLLPTEVRDHHHVLGYLRLTQPDQHGGTGRWIHNALLDPNNTTGRAWGNDFRENALAAIATVGLFHRKAMKLQDCEADYTFLPSSPLSAIPCLVKFLQDKQLLLGKEYLKPDRVPLLVALLRIIDSLDEQASRTGGPEAVRFHLELLETEAKEEEDRAAGLGQALTALAALCPSGYKEIQKDLDTMIERLFGTYTDKESKKGQNESGDEKNPTSSAEAKPAKYTNAQFWSDFNEKVPEKSNGQDNPLRPLALEYANAKLRAEFKRFQKEPYEEKLPIAGISLEHQIKENEIHFTVDLVMEPDAPNGKLLRQKMLNNLKEEYDQENVAEILRAAGIVLDYEKGAA